MTDGGSFGLTAPYPSLAATDVLLVEDDDGDALLVEELVLDGGEAISLRRARTLAEAVGAARGAACALVDLGLPDASGLEAVAALREAAPELAVVVLTGLGDRQKGTEALAAGAQDYLVKGEVDGPALARAIRYAVERRQTEAGARRLALAEQRQAENERLARGLLPTLLLDGSPLAVATRYVPGGRDAVVGGDFYDAVERPDGSVRVVIGDVCGHGPDEAAVGVALRIAWRALVVVGASPDDVLAGVDDILRLERGDTGTFATVCDLTFAPTMAEVAVRLHGHPPPLLVAHGTATWMESLRPAMPLGALDHQVAPVHDVPLVPGWQLLVVTDGLYEARVEGEERLGMEALAGMVSGLIPTCATPQELLDRLFQQVVAANGGHLDDDAAALWCGPRS
ncbi:MAG TPA: SpoIIE family protein phosphatase [Iamia sp.]|jgi:serine phosphatase RsbU (regulator of sigma subunit)|nr:SpoIIE family protein phosphatase [Iamia sp.]